MVNIAGLSKAAVLAALHNGTRAMGMGRFHDLGRDMTVEEAQTVIDKNGDYLRFDYVKGHPIKADLSRDEFDEALYDRDAGIGQAAEVIKELRDR